jgi:tryptophan 7-halogenase
MPISSSGSARMPVERIVIVGGGVAGWCAASALARKTQCQVIVVDPDGEDKSLGVPAPAISTLPSAALFHAELGHDEDAMLAACAGTFSLGTAISGFAPGAPSFIPYGDIGAPLGPISFHHLVARLRSEGKAINLANYSVAALCAQAGRFGRPPAEDRSVLSTLEYGFHMNSDAYAAWLQADALAHGAEHMSGEIGDVRRDADGLLTDVVLYTGQKISGDLFIDASGVDAALFDRLEDRAFESWASWLPLNRCVAKLSDDRAAPPPYTHVDAHASGVQRFSPVQGSMAEQILFCSEFGSGQTTALPFTPGCRRQPWTGNCLALGGAAFIADPSTPIALHMLHASVGRLLTLLPHDRACRIEAREFNRQFGEECDGARDLMILPYLRNGRTGDPFWDRCRATEAPDRLAHRIALYEHTGRVALHDGDLIEAAGWVAWFDALGIRPQRYDVMADGIPLDEIEAHLERIRAIMLKTLATLPTHAEYLLHHCPTGQRRAA